MKDEDCVKIETREFVSTRPGEIFLAGGLVHGNEVCGKIAQENVMRQFDLHNIFLKQGTIIFAPICNPRAFEAGTRRADGVDMNRSFIPRAAPKTYTEFIQNQLCGLIARCTAYLDKHSSQTKGPAYALLGPTNDPREISFIRALGVTHYAHGWQNVFNAAAFPDPHYGKTTTDYARSLGKMAVTMECGSHDDPNSIKKGMEAIIRSLIHFDMVDVDPDLGRILDIDLAGATPRQPEICVEFFDVVRRRKPDGHFSQPWHNFSAVKQGDPLVNSNDGHIDRAPEDCMVMLPVWESEEGVEHFYLARPSDRLAKLAM